MIIRTKLISFEVKNIDLSDLYDLYQKEDNTVSEKIERRSDGRIDYDINWRNISYNSWKGGGCD